MDTIFNKYRDTGVGREEVEEIWAKVQADEGAVMKGDVFNVNVSQPRPLLRCAVLCCALQCCAAPG